MLSRVSFLVLVCLVLVGAGAARATLLVYEPFAYNADTTLDGLAATGLNLTGDYTALGTLEAQRLVIGSPGLDYGNLTGVPSASANRVLDEQGVTAAGATIGLGQEVIVNPGEAIYFSALFTFDDSIGRNHHASVTLTDDATGDLLFIGEPAVGIGGVRVAASTAALGELVADGADNAFVDGDTLFLLGRYFNSAAPAGDSLDLIGYNTADAVALPTSFDPADPDAMLVFGFSDRDIDLAKITSVTFTIRGQSNNFIDELRIGTTYASIVPEPSAVALMLLAVAGLTQRLARRDARIGRE